MSFLGIERGTVEAVLKAAPEDAAFTSGALLRKCLMAAFFMLRWQAQAAPGMLCRSGDRHLQPGAT